MESFEAVAKKFEPMIHRIIQSLHIYKDKDEYFQIGLIGLWEAYERFDPSKGKFFSYAYSFVWGRILEELKKSKRHDDRNVLPDTEFWLMIDSADVSIQEKELLLSMKEVLSEKQFELAWQFVCGLSVKEVAEKEGVSESAIKKRRAIMRTQLARWKEEIS
jgi:RNA polymerase sigma factor (sigma-70 family)